MTDRTVRVALVGDASSLISAATQARTALTGLSNVNMGGVQTGISGVTKVTQEAASAAGGWGQALKVGLGVVGVQAGLGALAQGFRAFINIGMEFQGSMNTLHAVTGANTEQMAQLSAQAIKLGADIRIPGASAADAAEAMKELAKGGLSVNEAIGASTGTLMLSVAAQVSAGQAAQFQVNALNAFGLSAEKASHVADLLANSANAASGEVTDMAGALQQTATVASSFGISIDETVTTLGLFAKNGVMGSDAGTSFKTMLTQLSSPTKQQVAALKMLNLTVFDAKGNFVGMRSITDQLSKAHQRLTTEQYQLAAGTAFGTDALRTANILGKEGVQGYDDMYAATERANGAQILAAAQMEGLNGALSNFSNFAENAANNLFQALQPAMVAVVNAAGGLVAGLGAIGTVFAALPGPVDTFVLALAAVTMLKGPLSSLWETIALKSMYAKDALVASATGMKVGIAGLELSFAGLKVAAVGAMTAIKAAFMANPIGLALVGVTTVLSFFVGKTEEATQAATDYSAAIDQNTGKLLANGEAQKVIAEAGKDDAAAYRALGGAFGDWTAALAGDAPAIDRVHSLIQKSTVAALEGSNTWAMWTAQAGHSQDDINGFATALLAGNQEISQNDTSLLALIDVNKRFANGQASMAGATASTTDRLKELKAAQDQLNSMVPADVEAIAKAIKSVNEAMGDNMSAIAFKDAIDRNKAATDAFKQASEALTVSLLGVGGGEVTAAANARGYAAAMRGIQSAARQHESALAGVATAQAALDKLRAHGSNTAEDVANAQKSADKAAKDVLTSQQDLMKAQQKAAQDLQDAQQAAAKQRADDAKTEKDDRAAIVKAQIEADKDVRDAEKRLAKDKAEGAKKVAEERAAVEKDRIETAKALADAQTELSKARDSAAREIALAQARVDKLAGNKRYTAQERADAARHLADAKALGQADINEAQGKVTDVRTKGGESAATHQASLADALAKNRETIAEDEAAIREARGKGAEAIRAAQEKLAEDVAKSAENQVKSARSIAEAVQSGADSIASAQQRVVDSTDGAAEAQRKLADEQAKSVPTAAELAAAERAVADANAAVADAADGQAAALDKAGQAARDAAAAAYEKAGGDANAQAAAKAAGDEMAIQRQKFIDSAMAAGYGADEANRLADQQGLIPSKVETTYAESGHEGALLKAKALQDALDKIPGVKTVKFVAVGSVVVQLDTSAEAFLNYLAGQKLIKVSGKAEVRAEGGFIHGPGGPTEDKINARLSNGEFVVNAAQAAKHGSLLEDINAGRNGYAGGGAVSTGAVAAPNTSVVGKAWDGVSDKIVSTWDRTVSPTLDALSVATEKTGTDFVDLQKKSVEPTWTANGNAIVRAATGVIQPTYDTLNARTAEVGNANRSLHQDAVVPAWSGISDKVVTVTDTFQRSTFPAYVSGLQGLGSAGRTLAADTAASWDSIGNSINATYTNHIAPAWSAVQGFTTSMGAFFGGVNTGMLTASTTTTKNLGTITTAINEFFKLVDGKAPAPTPSTAPVPAPVSGGLPKLADGGMITAGTGPRADDVHIRASKGEYVVNAASTAKHKDTLDRINYGGAYADGGLIGEKIGNRVGNAIIGGAEKAISAGVDRILASVPAGIGAAGTGGSGGYVSNQQWGPGTTTGFAANTKAAKDFITGKWGITDIGGLYGGSVPGSDHPIGKALDVMIANYKTPPAIALGTSVADWFRTNVMSFGSKYVIWRDQIDNLKGKGWEPYNHPSGNNDTLQHRDHVHLSFLTGTGEFSGHVEAPADDVPTPGGWLGTILKKIKAGGTGTTGGGDSLITGPPGQWGTTRLLDTIHPMVDHGPVNMGHGTAAMVGPVPPGGAEERWRPLYLHALGMLGKPLGAIDKMMYQMHRESSGDPLAIEETDINFRSGHPSKGLLQTIPSTFVGHAPAGYNTNIWDPLSNALASLNYIKDPYKYPGGAYDNGGMLQPGWNFNGLDNPEPVLTDAQWGVASRAMNYTIGGGSGLGDVTVNARVFVGNQEITDIARVEAEVVMDNGFAQLGNTVTRMAAQS